MSYVTYKYRIYPTQEQSELINKTIATVGIEARGEKVRPQDVNLNGSLCEARKIVV